MHILGIPDNYIDVKVSFGVIRNPISRDDWWLGIIIIHGKSHVFGDELWMNIHKPPALTAFGSQRTWNGYDGRIWDQNCPWRGKFHGMFGGLTVRRIYGDVLNRPSPLEMANLMCCRFMLAFVSSKPGSWHARIYTPFWNPVRMTLWVGRHLFDDLKMRQPLHQRSMDFPIFQGNKWANAQVPPTPFQGRSGGERSKRPTRAVVQTYKYYGTLEGLGSVNIDCGTMNRMYWYQGFPCLFIVGLWGSEAFESCCGGFEGFKGLGKLLRRFWGF